MVDAMHLLHTFKAGFLLRQASKMAKANVNTLRPEPVKKQKVDA